MKIAFAIVALLAAAPVSAEVVSASANGFHLRHAVTVSAPPAAAFARFVDVARWWDPDHTYGGKAAGLTLTARPGGCFCETLPTGGVEHLRVAYVEAGKRMVLTGGLGPLLYEATAGAMDVKFEPQGAGTRVTVNYKVSGFAGGGADKLAPLVDKVLAGQWSRYEASLRAR